MVSRGRHQKKEIADVLEEAEPSGFRVVEWHSGHRWGSVICEECESSRYVSSTPRNPSVHAKQLKRFIAIHKHP